MDFVELAQECAPSVAATDLAAIVQVQSAFDPYVIRMTSGRVLAIQPRNFDEAVTTATKLVLEGADIEMGLAGISLETLNAAGNGIQDAFDPCKNLAMTANLLTLYQTQVGSREDSLALFYGHGDLQAGILAGYAKTIDTISAQLTGKLEQLTLKPGGVDNLPVREWTGNPITLTNEPHEMPFAQKGEKYPENDVSQSWDVFGQSKTRATVFFQER